MATRNEQRLRRTTKIVHDAEYYILEAQHGARWAAEDQEIDQMLAELRQKHGAPPNIIHIMWDDTAVGEVGIPAIQKVRGFETPNINRLAAEGINFMRMYTEPSCTPSRAAVLTGRHAVRNGMFNVGFPYEYGGLAASEITTAKVLSKAGYATAFFGKAHLGDVEASYMTNHGFDEALWTPYNQVPSLYTPQGQMAALAPAVHVSRNVRQGSLRHGSGLAPDGLRVRARRHEGRPGARIRPRAEPRRLHEARSGDAEADHRVHSQERGGEEAVLCRLLAHWDFLPRLSEPGDRQRRVPAGGARAARRLDRRA